MRIVRLFRVTSLLAATLGAVLASAEPKGFKPTPLLRAPLSGDDSREAIVATAQFAPGGTTGRHTHPGDEYGTLLEGTLEILVEGEAPRQVHAGEAFHNAKGVIHESRNIGSGIARVVSTFVVAKGKPISEPAD